MLNMFKDCASICGFSLFTFFNAKKCKSQNNNGDVASILTTGPVIRAAGVGNLYVKILNNTNTAQQVKITLYNIENCPKTVAQEETLIVMSKCSVLEVFDIGPSALNLEEFEVQIQFLSGATEGIYAFVAGAQGNSFNLEPSNVFRHEELVSQFDP